MSHFVPAAHGREGNESYHTSGGEITFYRSFAGLDMIVIRDDVDEMGDIAAA